MASHFLQSSSDEPPIIFVFTMNKGTIDVGCEREGRGQEPTLGTALKSAALFSQTGPFFSD